jgi:hypothetical protein
MTLKAMTVDECLALDVPPPLLHGEAPLALANNTPRVRGEALAPIWWRAAQWAVTSYGIECLDGTYAIEHTRLLEMRETWPHHMAGKIWVDLDEFATAWLIALVLHGYLRRPGLSPGRLREIFSQLPLRPPRPPVSGGFHPLCTATEEALKLAGVPTPLPKVKQEKEVARR